MKLSQYNIYKTHMSSVLIFNTLYRGMVEIDKDMFLLIEENISKLNSLTNYSDIKVLIDEGFIVDDDTDEYMLFQYFYNKNRYRTDYLSITLLVTEKCNFACPYCYEDNSRDNELSYNLIEKLPEIMNKLLVSNRYKFIDFNFYGGEPLLELDKILYISNLVDQFSKMNEIENQKHIVTNGYFLNEKSLRSLKKAGIKSLQVTLDGNRVSHNLMRRTKRGEPTYNKVVEGMLNAVKYGFEVTMNINFSIFNINDISDLLCDIPYEFRNNIFVKLNEIIKSQYNQVDMYKMTTYTELKKLYRLIFDLGYDTNDYELIEDGACLLETRNTLILDVHGNISKCIYGVHDDRFNICNVHDENWINRFIYNDPFTKTEIDDKCKKCSYLPYCKGGCYKSILDNDKYCNPNKIRDSYIELIFHKYIEEESKSENI